MPSVDLLTVGDLRKAIADLPDDAPVYHLNLETGNLFAAFRARAKQSASKPGTRYLRID